MLGDYDDDDRMRPTASRRDTLAVPVLIAACVFVGFTACAAVLTAPNDFRTGNHANLSAPTSFRNLLTRLAAHMASEAEAERFSGVVNEGQADYGENSLLDDGCFESDET